MEAQMKEAEMQLKDTMNQRDNETKILIAGMGSQSQEDGIQEQEFSEESRANLLEKMREFDERLKLDRERHSFDKEKAQTDAKLKEKQISDLEASIARRKNLLANENYVAKAPEAVVEGEKAKMAKYQEMLDAVLVRIEAFK